MKDKQYEGLPPSRVKFLKGEEEMKKKNEEKSKKEKTIEVTSADQKQKEVDALLNKKSVRDDAKKNFRRNEMKNENWVFWLVIVALVIFIAVDKGCNRIKKVDIISPAVATATETVIPTSAPMVQSGEGILVEVKTITKIKVGNAVTAPASKVRAIRVPVSEPVKVVSAVSAPREQSPGNYHLVWVKNNTAKTMKVWQYFGTEKRWAGEVQPLDRLGLAVDLQWTWLKTEVVYEAADGSQQIVTTKVTFDNRNPSVEHINIPVR